MSDSRCIFTGNQKAKCCNVSSWIRSKIKDEGVQARNIIKYSVPVDNPSPSKRQTRKCDFSLSSSEIVPKMMADDTENDIMTSTSIVSSHKEGGSRRSSLSSIVDIPEIINNRISLYTNKFHEEHSKSDAHSVSLISNTNSKTVCPAQSRHCRRLTSTTKPTTALLYRKPLTESEYKARYWGQMLDTLRRTIDEIYSACETDENEVECKEVIMILEHSKQDFFSLIEKMNLLRDYEQADEQNKPNSLAWDERTTLPGKPIMCQVLASTAFASVKKPSYPSIPSIQFSNKSDSSVIEIVDCSDSEFFDGNDRSGSNSCISDRRCKLLNAKKNNNSNNRNSNSNNNNNPNGEEDEDNEEEEPSSLSRPSMIPSLPNDYESCKRVGAKRIHCNSELQQTTTYNNSSSGGRDKFKLCSTGLDNQACHDNDGDEEEVDAYTADLSMCRTTDENDTVDIEHDHHRHHNHQGEDMTRYTYLVDDDVDDEYADQEDNTLSRDLEKLDKAIEHVTTAERVLSHQLDRAQLAEAALRRRLIEEEEEKAAFVQSTGYNQSWYLHRHWHKNGGGNNNNTNNNNNNSGSNKSFIKPAHNQSHHLKSGDIHRPCNTTDELGIDTDADVVDIDSVTLDDDDVDEVDESEKLIVTTTTTTITKEKMPTSVTNHQPLNSAATLLLLLILFNLDQILI
ncbi:unnamed protein product [Trichobilharzia szidati]|nr:unnamed protein product [Trichobilharzia szidati]